MKFRKKNGLYRPEYYMGCMGIEDGFPPNRSNVAAIRKGVMSPTGGGGTTGGSAGSTPAPSYLLEENFDAATLCATGYTETCTNTWTLEAGGTPDFDSTANAAPLEGTYSLLLPGTGGTDIRLMKTFTPTANAQQEAYFLFNISNTPGASSQGHSIVTFSTAAVSPCNYSAIWDQTNFHLRVTPLTGTAATTVASFNPGDTVHVWVYWKHGADVDQGVGRIAFSTDGTKPTSGDNYAESTDGDSTVDANRIKLYGDYNAGDGGVDCIFDKIRVDDVDIGSNPT